MKNWFLKYRKKAIKDEVKTLGKVYGLDTKLSNPKGIFYARHKEGVQSCVFLASIIVFGNLYVIGDEGYFYLSNVGRIVFSLLLLLSGIFTFLFCKFYDNISFLMSVLITGLISLLFGGVFMVLLTVMRGFVILMTGDRY